MPLDANRGEPNRVLTLARCREHLGDLSATLTDDQVLEIRGQADQLAEAIFNRWLRRRSRRSNADSQKNDGKV